MSSNPEDLKLVTLANATKLRTHSLAAAALRDSTGRTYVAIPVSVGAFTIDALMAVLVVAKASQIDGIEAIVVAGEMPEEASISSFRTEYPESNLYWIPGENELIPL